jgi:predicted nuclease of restriction endonuclease-like RecB superfamily
MLRWPQVEPFVRERDGALEVDFLPGGERAVALLDRLCRLVRRLRGSPRGRVEEALRRQERRVRDVRRLQGLAKSLLDRCDFRPPPGAERAEEVRAALFRARGRRWPPLPGDAELPYRDAAAELGTEPAEVHRLLYADVPAAQALTRPAELDGEGLLNAYNLDLARGVLLRATRVTLHARGGWRDLFRAVKLARLMYTLAPEGEGYRLELTGPAAAFVVKRDRYGARFARLLPALARAPGWRLEADVAWRGGTRPFRLDARTLPGAAAPVEPGFDSTWERALADDFAERIPAGRGWTLLREATPVARGTELFLPDFTLRNADGREALVEVVGFWTPEYLQEKLRKVKAAKLKNLVLVVYRGLAAGAVRQVENAPVVWFADKPRAAPVLEAAERIATRPPRPRR